MKCCKCKTNGDLENPIMNPEEKGKVIHICQRCYLKEGARVARIMEKKKKWG